MSATSNDDVVMAYLRFARFKRLQSMKELNLTFSEIFDKKLTDTTYTTDEVKDLLIHLHRGVTSLFDSDLQHMSHSNIVLMKQFMAQSDRFGLRLKVNIGELENHDLLLALKEYESSKFSALWSPQKSSSSLPGSIAPTGYLASLTSKLQAESEILKAEQERLLKKQQSMESELKTGEHKLKRGEETLDVLRNEKSRLEALVEDLRKEIDTLKLNNIPSEPEKKGVGMSKTTQSATSLNPLRQSPTTTNSSSKPTPETPAKEISILKDRISSLEKDLDAKLMQSKPFQNLKRILTQKNTEIKSLRERLNKYEPTKFASELDIVE